MPPFTLFGRKFSNNDKHDPSLETPSSLSAEMGANPSKATDSGPETHRKPLRPRSSLNLLKRTRTPSGSARVNSGSTQTSCPPSTLITGDGTDSSRNSNGHKSGVQQASLPSTVAAFVQHASTPDSDKDSLSSYSTSSTATPATTAEETKVASADEESSDSSRHATPVPIPRISLPTTFVLPEDSPTKYGLRTTQTPSPELSLSQAQRLKMTAGALFQHAAAQLKIHQDSPALRRLAQKSSFSSSSPSLLPVADSTPRPHGNSLPSRTGRTRVDPSHKSLFKEDHLSHVAHALPLQMSQRNCFHVHDRWHPVAKPGMHRLRPVSCVICDGYEAPGDDFKRCHWCWMIACGECHKEFAEGGVSGMMARQWIKAENSSFA